LIQGGTNKHGNIAFVEPRVFNLIFNDNINEAKIQLAKLKLEEVKRNRLNKIRRNYGYQSI
jgi:RNA-directed DNA polymerase